MINRILFVLLSLLLLTEIGIAHDPQTDPELAELNDYLMAIQVLRHGDSKAETLFQQWQQLRESSWKIRELTDEEGLSIEDPKVKSQIENTLTLRKNLLRDIRSYLQKKMDILPSIRVQIGEKVDISGLDNVVSTPVGSRKVVLVQLSSEKPGHTHLYLDGDGNEQILFWSKPITIENSQPRYTFVYIAPQEADVSETNITIKQNEQNVASFIVRGKGTLPATYSWYNHIPAESPTDIHHLTYDEVSIKDASISGESIRFDIRHPETNRPMPVRVEVKDDEGNSYWTPLRGPSISVDRERTGWQTPLWTFQSGPFFYINGEATLGVNPKGKTVRIYHGFEFEPTVVEVPENGLVNTAPKRWINMAERGWYSGHTHIHTTDIGLPVQYSRFWPLVTQGEGLGVSAILTLQGERMDHAIYSDEYPMGTLESHSDSDHLITFGEEYRNNPYGHLALLGLDHLILPLSSGSLGEVGGADYPPNQFVLEDAVSQGGVTIGAHFGSSIMESDPIISSWPATGFEMPVNVALGTMHLAEIYGNAGQLDIWYKLLNSGFNIAATAGPDWSMKDTPRAYVYLGEQTFNVDNWLSGLKEGRSFITRGPMLFFKVDEMLPGSEIDISNGPLEVTVEASAINPEGNLPVEIIVNGEVVASGTEIHQTIMINDSAWIAARTENAHSNPVYVNIGNRTRGYAEEAEEFIEVIDRLEKWVNSKGLYESSSQKETVLNVLHKGRSVYEQIAERAREFNRTSPYFSN